MGFFFCGVFHCVENDLLLTEEQRYCMGLSALRCLTANLRNRLNLGAIVTASSTMPKRYQETTKSDLQCFLLSNEVIPWQPILFLNKQENRKSVLGSIQAIFPISTDLILKAIDITVLAYESEALQNAHTGNLQSQ